ncbi:hypothetical protein BJD99_01545 [Rhodococcus sp. 1163]|nr:hypothetical protein BJD99_01545 [Rhodococcus sp. 1163]
MADPKAPDDPITADGRRADATTIVETMAPRVVAEEKADSPLTAVPVAALPTVVRLDPKNRTYLTRSRLDSWSRQFVAISSAWTRATQLLSHGTL